MPALLASPKGTESAVDVTMWILTAKSVVPTWHVHSGWTGLQGEILFWERTEGKTSFRYRFRGNALPTGGCVTHDN